MSQRGRHPAGEFSEWQKSLAELREGESVGARQDRTAVAADDGGLQPGEDKGTGWQRLSEEDSNRLPAAFQ